MRILGYSLATFLLATSSACCSYMGKLNDPERPSNVRRWEEFHVGSVTIKGDFVLKKGESTDNGKIGIRIVQIYEGECQPFSEPQYPKAKIQFYRVSDNSIICEPTLRIGNSGLNYGDVCGTGFEWTTISITAINSREDWVAFDLRE